MFLKQQLLNFEKKRPSWSDGILRDCVLWKACSSKGYNHVRERGLLKLPCRTTLQKYVGSSDGEIGITSLILERLKVERAGLKVQQETYCSLIIDEMSIQEKTVYDRQVDRIFGFVDMGKATSDSGPPQVANRLLCFVLRGLATSYVIPVAYFFTRRMKHAELQSMTLAVMEAVESCGFHVVRLVTDNHQTNTAMFRDFSEDGILQHVVRHPLRENDLLFLSFDPNHIIKNLRNNLLEREMSDGEETICGGRLLRELFDAQKDLLVKPVRFLTRSHVDPTNLEKMKVSRAKHVFSSEVINTLNYLRLNPECHPKAAVFQDSGATIQFMDMIRTWYNFHDISRWCREPDMRPFTDVDDPRLLWLEVDFLCYLEELKITCRERKHQFLTKETYEATLITTRSTVGVVGYLLDDAG